MITVKTVWYRMVETVLPAAWLKRPAPDVDRNDAVLASIADSDPTLRALQDHAFAQFDQDMTAALDMDKAPGVRISHLDRAAGVASFLTNVENVRDRARSEAEGRAKQREQAAMVKRRRV